MTATTVDDGDMGIIAERVEFTSKMTEKVEESMMDKVGTEDMEVDVSVKEDDDKGMPILTPEKMEDDILNSSLPSDRKDCSPSVAVENADGTSNSSGCSDNDKTSNCNTPSALTTPSANRASISTNLANTPTSTSTSKKRKRLTPEERLLKDQERQEKRRKLEEEKQRKEQERLDRLKVKEEEKKKREEEKRIKDEEKKQKEEERIKKAEEDRVKKEEERVKKEEERLKKEEERKKKEEERLQKEEQRRKKEDERKKILEEKEREKQKAEEIKAKQVQLFTKFFTPNKNKTAGVGGNKEGENDDKENKEEEIEVIDLEDISVSTPTQSDKTNQKRRIVLTEKKFDNLIFAPKPFQMKTDMNLAPLVRRSPLSTEERSALDKLTSENIESAECVENMEISENCDSKLEIMFITDVKARGGRKSLKTEVKYDSEVQVITGNFIENPNEAGLIKWRMKLIQFHENRRPAYFGTYKRKPLRVTGRRPFTQEEELDYEFDSDDEWEDEPEDGEDLDNSDHEKEPDDPDGVPEDEEDEEGWMVPHGYLSDGEGGEHQDLEVIKSKEKEFYKSLKQQIKMGLPVIETEDLHDYKVILFPKSVRRKIRRSKRPRKAPSASDLTSSRGRGGILSLDLPSEDEDDSWTDASDSESGSDSDSSDSENESGITSEDELTPNEKSLSDSEYDSEDSNVKNISSVKNRKRSDNVMPRSNVVPLE